jgi:hypothetical protein
MRNLLCGLIVLLASGVAHAGTVYSTFAAWQAAVPGSTTVNFEGLADPFGFIGPITSETVGGVNFSLGPNGTNTVMFVNGDGGYGYPGASISVQVSNASPDSPVDLLISLPSAVTAIAFDFGDITFNADFGHTATITLFNGLSSVETDFKAAGVYSTTAFFGVTNPAGITKVDITLPADSFVLNLTDFSYGSLPNNVPEPSSLLLCGAGLAVAAGILRRRRTS